MLKLTGLASALFRRLLSGPITYLVGAFRYFVSKAFFARATRAVSLRSYCAQQLQTQNARYLYVPGRIGRSVELNQVYVPTQLASASEFAAVVNLDDITGAAQFSPSRLIVIGEPGSGKTTLTKYAFRASCLQSAPLKFLRASRTPLQIAPRKRRRLPIYADLKNLVPPTDFQPDEYGAWALAEMRRLVVAINGYEMSELFEAFIGGAGLDIYLDALDEVAPADVPKVITAVNQLGSLLEKESADNRIVMTMRSQFYRQVRAQFIDNFSHVARVREFRPDDMYEFLSHWPFPEDRKRSEVARISRQLADRPSLRDMCSNPLVLSMYVISDQQDPLAGAPETRTSFYSEIVDELLAERRGRQMQVQAKAALREQRERILGELAWTNMVDPDASFNLISWSDALLVVSKVYKCSTEAANERLDRLIVDTGILEVQAERSSLRFIHRTFCEFLAAKYALGTRSLGWRTILSLSSQLGNSDSNTEWDRWAEVLPFASGLLGREDRLEFLDRISSSVPNEIVGHSLLETQAFDSPAWTQYVESELSALATLPVSEDSLRRRLYLLNVTLREAEEWSSLFDSPPQFERLQVLAQLFNESQLLLSEAVALFAERDAPSAFRFATDLGIVFSRDIPAVGATACENTEFLDIMLGGTSKSEQDSLQWQLMLVEASQTFRSTAQHLLTIESSRSDWMAKVRSAKRREKWRSLQGGTGLRVSWIGYWARTNYEQVGRASLGPRVSGWSVLAILLTLNAREVEIDATLFPRARRVQKVRGPGYSTKDVNYLVLTSVPFTTALTLFLLLLELSGVDVGLSSHELSHVWLRPLSVAALVISGLAGLLVPSWTHSRKRIYRMVANLARPDSDSPSSKPVIFARPFFRRRFSGVLAAVSSMEEDWAASQPPLADAGDQSGSGSTHGTRTRA